jgi:sugar lactone lactonase YvrE/PKD repeat protein
VKKSFITHYFILGVSLIFSGWSQSLSAQKVTTYAGVQYTDSAKYLGTADNPKNTELYSRPSGIAVDSNGRIWVTDEHNVMLLDAEISRNRGGYRGDPTSSQAMGYFDGTGPVARFTFPAGIAVDPSSNDVYFCDRDNSTIRKASKFVNASSGTVFSTFAGKADFSGGYVDANLSDARFNYPEDIQFDKNGVIYVCDFMNHCIRKITGGAVSTLAGKGKSSGNKDGIGTDAQFSFPSGIGMDSNGDLLVADRNNNAIRRINLSSGQVTTVTKEVKSPVDVIGIGDKIYILEPTCIKVWNGSSVSLFCGSPTVSGYKDGTFTESRFGNLTHFDFHQKEEVLYVVDNGNNVIRRVPLALEATADFFANNRNPTVNQTIILTSTAQNYTNLTWEITPSSYTLESGSKLTDKIIYVSFANATAYTVKLTSKNNSSQSVENKQNHISVSTNNQEKPAVDFTVYNTYPLINDEVVHLINLTANNPTTYKWTITPNTFTFVNSTDATMKSPALKFNAFGLYSISLECENSNGSNVKSKNNFIQVIGLNTSSKEKLKVVMFPNPSTGTVFLTGLPENSQLRATDITGKCIKMDPQHVSNDSTTQIELPASGIYFLQVLHDGQWQNLGKLVVN